MFQTQIINLYRCIDNKDVPGFVSQLTDDCQFRFANIPAVTGKQNIEQFVSGFFASVKAISHAILQISDFPQGAVCHGMVSYTRHDDSVLSVPFACVFKLQAGLISEYLIFVDASEL